MTVMSLNASVRRLILPQIQWLGHQVAQTVATCSLFFAVES